MTEKETSSQNLKTETEKLSDSYKKEILNALTETSLAEVKDDKLILSESLQKYFFEETEISLKKEWDQPFFWQRLASFVKDNTPQYFRISMSSKDMPSELIPLSKKKIMIFWFIVQYEAHKMIEEPLVIATDGTNSVNLKPDFIISLIDKLKPEKIYITQDELNKMLDVTKKNFYKYIEHSVSSLQNQMSSRLTEEIERIEEYYSHLIARASNQKMEDQLKAEQKLLENEHIRKFHPDSISVTVTPELLVSIIYSD